MSLARHYYQTPKYNMEHLPPINPPITALRRNDQTRLMNVAGNPNKPIPTNGNIVAAGSTNVISPNIPAAAAGEDGIQVFDYNFHSMKKGVSSALLDVALLLANVSQLKSVYLNGPEVPFYHLMMVLLILSLLLQLVIGVLLIWLGRININEADAKKHKEAELLNNMAVTAIFLLTLVNIFIAAIGISEDNEVHKNSSTGNMSMYKQ